MFIGEKKNPMYFGKKGELLAELNWEFFSLLDDALNHLSGFNKISIHDDYSEAYIVATRYLVLELMREYGNNGGF